MLESDRSGRNGARIRLLDSAGAPLNALEVDFTVASPSAGVEAMRLAAVAGLTGRTAGRGSSVGAAGSWPMRIDALISDFETTRFETVVTLR